MTHRGREVEHRAFAGAASRSPPPLRGQPPAGGPALGAFEGRVQPTSGPSQPGSSDEQAHLIEVELQVGLAELGQFARGASSRGNASGVVAGGDDERPARRHAFEQAVEGTQTPRAVVDAIAGRRAR